MSFISEADEQNIINELLAVKAKRKAWAEALRPVLDEVWKERERQDTKFGQQEWPDGTGPHNGGWDEEAALAKVQCDAAYKNGLLTWLHIAREEVFEAFAEADEAKLRVELIQCAAVFVAWAQCLDRRAAKAGEGE